jgi:hypothetical protein
MKISYCLIIFFTFFSNSTLAQNKIISQANPDSNKWIIVWGGKPSSIYGASFMKKEMEPFLSNKFNVIYSDYENSFDKIQKFLNLKVPNNSIEAVYGFSMGGVNAFNQIGKINFIGLIDPLIPSDYKIDLYYNNVFMIFNLEVWPKENRIRLKRLSNMLMDSAKEIKKPHSEMPRIFAEKYMYKLDK